MREPKYRFICLLLALVMLMDATAGCEAKEPAATQVPTASPAPSTSASTTPTVPNETSAPTTPTETTVPTESTAPTAPIEPPTVDVPTLLPPAIQASQAFIYDTRIDHFVYTSTPTETALYPASITKLFTSYVALLHLELSDPVTIGDELSLVAPDASVAGLEQGSVWTVEGLLYAALLPSGCDASYVLAVATGRELLQDPDATTKDALNAFMTQCNFLAWELGMENTQFVTPDGYHHEDHYISIMAYPIIADCILSDEILSAMVAQPHVTVTYTNASGKIRTMRMNNTNRILRPDYPGFYRSEAVGLKTGSTTPAGFCLLSAFRVEGGYIIIGVFGCTERESRFADTNTLFDYYIENMPD